MHEYCECMHLSVGGNWCFAKASKYVHVSKSVKNKYATWKYIKTCAHVPAHLNIIWFCKRDQTINGLQFAFFFIFAKRKATTQRYSWLNTSLILSSFFFNSLFYLGITKEVNSLEGLMQLESKFLACIFIQIIFQSLN